MSAHYRPRSVNVTKDAWLIGKIYSNRIHDYASDLGAIKSTFGKSVETKLKLSDRGLTCSDQMKGILRPSRASPSRDFELSEIIDLFVNGTYSNLLTCLVKSSNPKYKYEVFLYKLDRAEDALNFYESFRDLTAGAPMLHGDQVSEQLGALGLSTVRRPASRITTTAAAATTTTRKTTRTIYSPKSYVRFGINGNSQLQLREPNNKNKAVQARLERASGDDLEFFCQKMRVYSSRGVSLADASCMTRPLFKFHDELDGLAAVYVGPAKGLRASDDDYYHDYQRDRSYHRDYCSPDYRDDYYKHSHLYHGLDEYDDDSGLDDLGFRRRMQHQTQTRIVSIADDDDDDGYYEDFRRRPTATTTATTRTNSMRRSYLSDEQKRFQGEYLREDPRKREINGGLFFAGRGVGPF